MTSRYYAEFTDIDPIFASKMQRGWQVFDRERTTPSGECLPLTLCVTRSVAFTLRDALNAPRFACDGNRGGSYVVLTKLSEGMVHLEVGESCLVTVDQPISVAALAAVLTWAKDRGFQAVVDEYCAGGGSPAIKVEEDTK